MFEFVHLGAFRRELGYDVWSRWMKEKGGMMNAGRKLSEMNIQEINSNLTDFICSLRRPNGKQYRPDIILYFLHGMVDYIKKSVIETPLLSFCLAC